MGVDIEAVTRDLPRDRQQAIRYAYAHQAKHDTSAFLFCFFLGTVGAHRFYLGQVGAGFARLTLPVLAGLAVAVGVLLNLQPVAIVAAVAIVLFFALAWEIIDLFRIDAMVDAHNEAVARRLLGAPTSALPIPPLATPARTVSPALSATEKPFGMLTEDDVAQARELALGVPTGMASGMAQGLDPQTAPIPPQAAPRPAGTTPDAPPVWPVDVAATGAATAWAEHAEPTPAAQPFTVHPLRADPTDQHAPAPGEALAGDAQPSYVRLSTPYQDPAIPGAFSRTPAMDPLAPIVSRQHVLAPNQDATDAPGPRELLGASGGDARPSGFVAVPPALAALGSARGEFAGEAATAGADLVTRPSVSGPITPEDAFLTLIPDEPRTAPGATLSPDDTLPWPPQEARPQTPSHPVPPEAFVPPSVSSPHAADTAGTVPPPRPPLWPVADDLDETTAPLPPSTPLTPPQDAPADDNLAELALGIAGGAAAGGLAAEALHHAEDQQSTAQPAPGMATQPEPPTQPLPAPTSSAAPAAAPASGALKKVRVVRRVVVDGKVVSERVVEEIVPVETDAATAVAALDEKLGHLTPEQAAQLANLPPEAQLELRRKMEIERSPNTGTTGGTGNSGGGQQGQ